MTRLDAALPALGLARSRTHAARLITEGLVSVNGVGIVKPSHPVAEGDAVDVASTDHYVSRAAHKLIAALDAFDISVSGRAALDMGASTGGFTQVLRERGANPVLSVDVGHDQMSPLIAADPDVHMAEGFNVRFMTQENLAGATGCSARPSVVTGDLSFISLNHVLPAVVQTAEPGADIVLLIKPQFEVGRTAVKGGLVTNPATRADAVAGVLWSAWDAGLGVRGLAASPIVGTHGNSEYLVYLCDHDGENPTEYLQQIEQLTGVA